MEESQGIVQEIAAEAEVQATGVAEIHDALRQIDRVTQTNSAAAEQSAAAAEDLSTHASSLEALLEGFRLVVPPEDPFAGMGLPPGGPSPEMLEALRQFLQHQGAIHAR